MKAFLKKEKRRKENLRRLAQWIKSLHEMRRLPIQMQLGTWPDLGTKSRYEALGDPQVK